MPPTRAAPLAVRLLESHNGRITALVDPILGAEGARGRSNQALLCLVALDGENSRAKSENVGGDSSAFRFG